MNENISITLYKFCKKSQKMSKNGKKWQKTAKGVSPKSQKPQNLTTPFLDPSRVPKSRKLSSHYMGPDRHPDRMTLYLVRPQGPFRAQKSVDFGPLLEPLSRQILIKVESKF